MVRAKCVTLRLVLPRVSASILLTRVWVSCVRRLPACPLTRDAAPPPPQTARHTHPPDLNTHTHTQSTLCVRTRFWGCEGQVSGIMFRAISKKFTDRVSVRLKGQHMDFDTRVRALPSAAVQRDASSQSTSPAAYISILRKASRWKLMAPSNTSGAM